MADAEKDTAPEPQQSAPADQPAVSPQDSVAPPHDTTPFEPPFMDTIQGSDDFPTPPRGKR